MKILIACEYSGTVRDAFIRRGFDAMSCDLEPSETPGPHYQGDVMDILGDGWDCMIAFPPCTYLSYAAMWMWNKPGRPEKREEAIEFVKMLWNSAIPHIAIENPRGILAKALRPPDQTINPFEFGHNECKRTDIWLHNLPPLMATLIMGNRREFVKITNGKNRAKERARTFPGIAEAMADQWGKFLRKESADDKH